MKIPSQTAKVLSKKLKAMRGDRSLRDFARELNISHTQLARLEAADANATLITLDKLCQRLKMEPFELFEPMESYRQRKLEERVPGTNRRKRESLG